MAHVTSNSEEHKVRRTSPHDSSKLKGYDSTRFWGSLNFDFRQLYNHYPHCRVHFPCPFPGRPCGSYMGFCPRFFIRLNLYQNKGALVSPGLLDVP